MSDLTMLTEAQPEGEVEERFRFECAGGAVSVTAASDRLTPYGGAAAWSHYLEKLGVTADLARRFPLTRTRRATRLRSPFAPANAMPQLPRNCFREDA